MVSYSTKKRKARDLLLAHLTPEQRHTFLHKRPGYFDVLGADGKTYRVYKTMNRCANAERNIRPLVYTPGHKEPSEAYGFWVHFYSPYIEAPIEDLLLAQKLWLETKPQIIARLSC